MVELSPPTLPLIGPGERGKRTLSCDCAGQKVTQTESSATIRPSDLVAGSSWPVPTRLDEGEARLGWGCVVGKKLPDELSLSSIDDRRQLFEAGAAHLFKASEVSQ